MFVESDSHVSGHAYYSNYKPTANALRKHKIVKKLRNNENIIIVRPDKGNGVVILDKNIYLSKMHDLISDKTKFKCLKKDPTITRQEKLQKRLRGLRDQGFLSDQEKEEIYPVGSRPARLYGLPKLHKLPNINSHDKDELCKVLAFRPINSSIKAYNYSLAKYLSNMVTPIIPEQHSAKDSFSFVKEIQQLNYEQYFLCSYDVVSLFTNIPLEETIDLAVNLIFESNNKLRIEKEELRELFLIATAENHFLFNGNVYDQIDGISMGSPLAPKLANLFLGYHENEWLKSREAKNILFFKRYVDDIFCIMKTKNDAESFLKFLNEQHPNIKFTLETEVEGKLPFLDILVQKQGNTLNTQIYRKQTDTGLLTNFGSFTSFGYKVGLIKTLIDRVYKINNTWEGFIRDVDKTKGILQKNEYPEELIDKNIKKYVQDQQVPKTKSELEKSKGFYKLPYTGHFSCYTEKKLKQIIRRYCKPETSLKIVFTSLKLASFFSTKDKIRDFLRSWVIYKFSCAGCESSYVGRTTRHVGVRFHEHLYSDQSSHVLKHLKKSKCLKQCR